MSELVFLLEERSMTEVLKIIVPPLMPEGVVCRFVPHQGKDELEKSIPRTLRGWNTPGVRFVVMRDKDSGDCKKVKKKLVKLCEQGHRTNTLVRIVCPHLESWFLGDLAAIEKAYRLRGIAKQQSKQKFAKPDHLANAEQELKKLVPRYQKIGGSRLIAPCMDVNSNKSKSFQAFISGIQRLVETIKNT